MNKTRKKIGEVLVDEGVVTRDQIENALVFQKGRNKRLGKVLVEMGYVTENDVARALSRQLSLSLVNPDDYSVTSDLLTYVPRSLAEKKAVFPLELKNKKLLIAMVDPLDWQTIDELSFRTGLNVSVAVAPESSVLDAIEKHYSSSEQVLDILRGMPAFEDAEFVQESTGEELDERSVKSIYKLSEAPPIVKLVTMILVDAVESRASDVHLDTNPKYVQVRYRVDGDLREVLKFPKRIQEPVISRIKIIANLDITNRRLPQDGRSTFRVKGKDIDLRISTMPSSFGENVVIRLLDHTTGLISLNDLGMAENILGPFMKDVNEPQGMVLVTGPTGSGKSTTLYAVLQQMSAVTDNIISIEDPVEYRIAGITQIETNEATGLTFPVALRSVFRQDPDIILVGEIRDLDTAEIAVRAALTGHLVLSTVHTNDTVATITRLIDIGLQRYLVSSSVTGVLAQRLIKKICPHCKQEAEVPELVQNGEHPHIDKCYEGVGCSKCNHTGYWGRVGVYEYLRIDSELKDMIVSYVTEGELWEIARANGITTLFEDAWKKVAKGVTTVEEVLSKVPYKRERRKKDRRKTGILLCNVRGEDSETITSILDPEGYNVNSSSSGDVLQSIRKYPVDLIFAGLSEECSKVMDSLAGDIRGILSPVFLIADEADRSKEAEWKKRGIKDFIYRPITKEKILDVILHKLKD